MERELVRMNYVFDVDGTLTPSRGVMDSGFKQWFLSFCSKHSVYLVTGSDYTKTQEQVGNEICSAVAAVYNCAGNAVYVKGQLTYQNDFKISSDLESYLCKLLDDHPYPVRTGNHIEQRIGLCNFSIVGRGANPPQRSEYVLYDRANGDRAKLVQLINGAFPEVEATAGGETGIDIYQRGRDKSQVADHVRPFTFFGDAIHLGGNDYTIAQLAEKYYHVKSWHETYDILQKELVE